LLSVLRVKPSTSAPRMRAISRGTVTVSAASPSTSGFFLYGGLPCSQLAAVRLPDTYCGFLRSDEEERDVTSGRSTCFTYAWVALCAQGRVIQPFFIFTFRYLYDRKALPSNAPSSRSYSFPWFTIARPRTPSTAGGIILRYAVNEERLAHHSSPLSIYRRGVSSGPDILCSRA
jgi:hypothetical protein